MSSKQEKHEWELPHLREAHQIPTLAARCDNKEDKNTDLWSVKFYPFNEPGVDPIFAVCGGEYILVCRTPKENKTIEVILSIEDEDPDANNFVVTWTKDLDTGTPLLCVGGRSEQVGSLKIINALTGKLHRALIGHGGEIEDLQVSPVNPQILASASEDCTVRIWSLDPAHAKQPCLAILAGDGHKSTVLSISFHANGRYLLSAGIDHIVNLWVLPEFPDTNTGTSKATQIYYPHFSTSEIHSGIVDCVMFYGDLILSKVDKDEEYITLWAINGFSSSSPPPALQTAPTTHDGTRDTRSAFTTTTSASDSPFTRLLHFSITDSNIMFTRFALYPGSATTNPVLAFCSGSSKVFFWDLARLETYHDYIASVTQSASSTTFPGVAPNTSTSFSSSSGAGLSSSQAQEHSPPMKRPAFLVPFRHRARAGTAMSAISRVREASPTESASSHHTGSESHPSNPSTSNPNLASNTNSAFTLPGEKPLSDKDLAKSKEIWAKRYDMTDPWKSLAPHKEEVVRGLEFTGRQVAFSTGGEWCVVVGSAGVLAVFERWTGKYHS